MSGSGGAPQLDERVEAHFDRQVAVGAEAHLRVEAERLRALIDPMKPQARAKYEPTVERLENARIRSKLRPGDEWDFWLEARGILDALRARLDRKDP